MDSQLLVSLKAIRNRFVMENYFGSDDIFALVKEGSFTVEWDGQSVTVRESEGFLFRKNILYHRRVISPVTMYLFRYQAQKPAFPCDHVQFQDQSRLSTTFAMLAQLDAGVCKEDFSYRCHLFQDLVVQYALEKGVVQSTDPVIEQAICRIRDEAHHGVNLTAIGEKTGLSYVQFLRRFKAFTGLSPSDYLMALRIQKAKELLTGTDLRIRAIANTCGFENEYYFSNFFKKHTGLSPTAFRAEFT